MKQETIEREPLVFYDIIYISIIPISPSESVLLDANFQDHLPVTILWVLRLIDLQTHRYLKLKVA